MLTDFRNSFTVTICLKFCNKAIIKYVLHIGIYTASRGVPATTRLLVLLLLCWIQ